MIVQRFNLNLIPNQSPVVVHVNQYDTGTGRLIATLYEGNEPYSPNGTAVIQGTKPDGHGFQYTATLDGNVVTADLTEQMSPVAGDVRTQIVVTESSGVTGTFVFIMRVQPSALPSDADMSESDYPLIEEAIREAQEATETAQEAVAETAENAENSEAWAQGTRGGIPVEPTDPTYEHNAEYWAQYAERYAQGGLHYKASIPFANIPTTGMREGDMYDITDDFTTDSRFTEGAGIKVKGGTNIAWNSDSKWDILALPYIPKTTFNGRSGSILPMAGDYDSKKILLTSALHIGGETQNDVQEALEALEGNKADKVDNAVEDNFAGLDANGNLKDSGKNAGDFATPSDIAGQQSLVKDTVGWTGKNLLKNTATSQTINGVTFTVNADGSVTANGTAASTGAELKLHTFGINDTVVGKKLILSGCPAGGGATTYRLMGFRVADATGVSGTIFETGEEETFDYLNNLGTGYISLQIRPNYTANNLTFYPMLRRADIIDPTYEPYHESVQNQLNAQGVLGAKNLLPNNATSQTINGVTFTVNNDGSVTANGTATALTILIINNAYELKAGTYILSGCPVENANVQLIKTRLDIKAYINSPATFTLSQTESGITARITIASGQTLSNAVFKPMLRLASDPDDTYQPYAMTNRELTEKKINIADLKTVVSASSDFADFKTRIASL